MVHGRTDSGRNRPLRPVLRAVGLVGLVVLAAGCRLDGTDVPLRGTAGPDPTGVTLADDACPAPPSDGPGVVVPAGSELPAPHTVSYGPVAEQQADLYLPPTPAVGTIVWIHGGAWVGGSRTAAAIPEAIRAQVANGWAVFSIDYRLAPQHHLPYAVYDVKTAVRFLKADGAAQGIPSGTPVVLAGHSAGAHVAMLAAVSQGAFLAFHTQLLPEELDVDPSVAGVISLAGVSDLGAWAQSGASCIVGLTPADIVARAIGCHQEPGEPTITCDRDTLQTLNPESYLDAGDPPALLVSGTSDLIVPEVNEVELRSRWEAAVGSEHVTATALPGDGHSVASLDPAVVLRFLDSLPPTR